MKIIISGLTAAGKTTHSLLLVQEFGFKYVSGSSLLLNHNNSKRIKQPLDFWISDESFILDAERMRNPGHDIDVENNLVEILEQSSENIVFDVWALPWESNATALRVWLESSLESRVMKAIVSYEGTSRFPKNEVYQRLALRDQRTRDFFLQNFGFDIFYDHSPFDVILDISEFIVDATPGASATSILSVQEILSSLVKWYLAPETGIFDILQCLDRHPRKTFVRLPKELENNLR